MTAESTGHLPWSPDPIRTELVLTAPFEIRLPIADITP